MLRSLFFAFALGAAACGYRSSPSQPLTPEVKSVAVGPANAAVAVGQTVQLIATAYDANGKVVTGLTVTWSSAEPGIATVDKNGITHGVTAGRAQISASVTSATGTLTVQVSP
ncbi:MAG TPA: Ig-like domain-containing protein [Gemmatimonadaceae bacterium]|nr:Ig-like domain-containing protein [Gemmatimonadaceae bacterium]